MTQYLPNPAESRYGGKDSPRLKAKHKVFANQGRSSGKKRGLRQSNLVEPFAGFEVLYFR